MSNTWAQFGLIGDEGHHFLTFSGFDFGSAMQLGFEAGGHATCDLWFPNTLGLLAVKNHQLLDTVPQVNSVC